MYTDVSKSDSLTLKSGGGQAKIMNAAISWSQSSALIDSTRLSILSGVKISVDIQCCPSFICEYALTVRLDMIPKLWPAPRSPHHRSGFSVAETLIHFPSAVISRAEIMLSTLIPNLPSKRLKPPPIHEPIAPTELQVPITGQIVNYNLDEVMLYITYPLEPYSYKLQQQLRQSMRRRRLLLFPIQGLS